MLTHTDKLAENMIEKHKMPLSAEVEVTLEMVKRYNRPGPRYTSYPTVPNWKEGEFSEDYATCLHEEG